MVNALGVFARISLRFLPKTPDKPSPSESPSESSPVSLAETLQQIEALIVAAPEGDASIFGTIWNRAYVIQVTVRSGVLGREAGAASSPTRLFEGALMHRWADVGDSRTRPAHKEVDPARRSHSNSDSWSTAVRTAAEPLYSPPRSSRKGKPASGGAQHDRCRCAEQQDFAANGAVYDKPASSPADDVAQAIGKRERRREAHVERRARACCPLTTESHDGGRTSPNLRALLIRTPAQRGHRPQHRSSATSWERWGLGVEALGGVKDRFSRTAAGK